jgi:hypothetical protein
MKLDYLEQCDVGITPYIFWQEVSTLILSRSLSALTDNLCVC